MEVECPHHGVRGILRLLEEVARTSNIESEGFAKVYAREEWDVHLTSEVLRTKRSSLDLATISHIMASSFEIDTIVAILTPLLNVALDFQAELRDYITPVISKLSKGIRSLPDELLSIIFTYAVCGQGWKESVNLSHVSRKFREVALAERSLWTTLHLGPRMSLEVLEVFISRSENAPFDVHVDIHPDVFFLENFPYDKIADVLNPTIQRWRTLEVVEAEEMDYDRDLDGIRVFNIHHFFSGYLERNSRYDGIPVMSSLIELVLRGEDLSKRHSFIMSLTLPNLRSLRCSEYIPRPSTAFSSVTTFSFDGNLDVFGPRDPVSTLSAFLSSMPTMVDLELVLPRAGDVEIDTASTPLTYSCPLLKTFHLRLPLLCICRDWERFIHTFLRHLRLPLLEDFDVAIDLLEVCDSISEGECITRFSNLSSSLLSFNTSFSSPHLSSLKYEITHNPSSLVHPSKSHHPLGSFPRTFPILLEKVPNVSTVTVSSCISVHFTRTDQLDAASNVCESNLREIRFVGCENMEVDHLQSAIQSLKDAGAWEAIDRITVGDCPSLTFEGALRVVGKDRLYMSRSYGSPLAFLDRCFSKVEEC